MDILRACCENDLTYLKENINNIDRYYYYYYLLECFQGDSTECFFYLISLEEEKNKNLRSSNWKTSWMYHGSFSEKKFSKEQLIELFGYSSYNKNWDLMNYIINYEKEFIDFYLYKSLINDRSFDYTYESTKYIINNYYNTINWNGLTNRINKMYEHEFYDYYNENFIKDFINIDNCYFIKEYEDKYLFNEKLKKELYSNDSITKIIKKQKI